MSNTETITETLPVGAGELSADAERFAVALAQHGNARKAYLDTFPDTPPARAAKRGFDLKHTPAVAARVHALRNAMAESFDITAAALKLRQYRVATAEPLTHVRVFCCRHCYSTTPGAPQWRDAAELALALDEALKSKGAKPIPRNGGFGFDPFAPPSPECPECYGAGKAVLYLPDTTQLNEAQAASYRGASMDKYGVITIETHDPQDAAFELARMIPGAIAPARSESRSVSVHVEPLKDMTPEQIVALMQQQRLLT
jgi:phage terminase small subunit